MREGPLEMVFHGVLFAAIAYLLMVFLLKAPHIKALNMSVLFGLFVAAYMILYGHKLPTKLNPNLL